MILVPAAADKGLGLALLLSCLPCIPISHLFQLLTLLGRKPRHRHAPPNAISGKGREGVRKDQGKPFTRPEPHSHKWNPQGEDYHPKPGGNVERKQRLAIKRSG